MTSMQCFVLESEVNCSKERVRRDCEGGTHITHAPSVFQCLYHRQPLTASSQTHATQATGAKTGPKKKLPAPLISAG